MPVSVVASTIVLRMTSNSTVTFNYTVSSHGSNIEIVSVDGVKEVVSVILPVATTVPGVASLTTAMLATLISLDYM